MGRGLDPIRGRTSGPAAGLPAIITAGLIAGCEQASPPPPPRPVPVTSTTVAQETVADTVPGVGTMRAIEISVLAPEVAGNVIGRYFEDGQRVRQGDILYTLDRRTQEAQLESTKAELAEQQWKWERIKILAATQAASDAEVAENAYAIESLTAQVAEQQATVDKLTIRAPYDGQIAIHMVDVGTYAEVGQPLVKVVNDSVMLVDYDVPSFWLSRLQEGQPVTLVTEADPTRTHHGRVTAINPFANDLNRSVRVRAQVPNPDLSLRSGLYAETVQTVGEFKDVLLVPQGALTYSRRGVFVYAIKDDVAVPVAVNVIRKIGRRAIVTPRDYAPEKQEQPPGDAAETAARTPSDLPRITLAAGLDIIVEGANKVRPGAKVSASPFTPTNLSVTTGLPVPPAGSGN